MNVRVGCVIVFEPKTFLECNLRPEGKNAWHSLSVICMSCLVFYLNYFTTSKEEDALLIMIISLDLQKRGFWSLARFHFSFVLQENILKFR